MIVNLDYGAIGDILRDRMAGPVRDAAESIAKQARQSSRTYPDAEVTTKDFTTDRAVTTVMLAHPASPAIEAKHGVLTKAASSQGFEVRSK